MGLLGENKDKNEAKNFDDYREEVVKWMQDHKFSEKKIEFHSKVVDEMAETMEEGRLKILEDGKLEYTLLYPLEKEGGDIYLEKLICKDRVNYNTHVKRHMRGVKQDDLMGMGLAYSCGVTGEDKAVIGKLEGRDQTAIANISNLFF